MPTEPVLTQAHPTARLSGAAIDVAIDPLYSSFLHTEKVLYILLASLVTLLGPLSGSIYFPALDSIARDLHASHSTVNLSITAFLVFQGIAPLLTAALSERYGRRPVLLVCLACYAVVNVGLALQKNIVMLFTLRSLQSVGSGGVAVVSMAVVADLVTRAERGAYMMYSSLGMTLAPVLGPVLGGTMTHFLGWRSIFVFLAVLGALLLLFIITIMPETCRAVVGNGTGDPQWWNRSCREAFWPSIKKNISTTQLRSIGCSRRPPTVLDSFRILRDPATALIVLSNMLIQSGYMAILVSISFLFVSDYGFNPLQVGLCYLPYAAGGITARWTVGTLADRNFKRHAVLAGVIIIPNRQTKEQLQAMPLEKARLQLTIPFLYASALGIIVFGWLANARVHFAGLLVLLAVLGNTITGVQSTLRMLLIDTHAERPAIANAANMLFRSLAGAAVAAAILPILVRCGAGWMATIIASFWMTASMPLWILYAYGLQWRDRGRGS